MICKHFSAKPHLGVFFPASLLFPFPWCFVLLRFCLSHLASISASDIKDHLSKLLSFLFPAPREEKKSDENTVHCVDQ